MQLTIDIFSDVICPWCYIGKRRLERALLIASATKPLIRWHAFELNPDMPKQGIERSVYRSRKFGSLSRSRALDDKVEQAGRESGIAFAFDRIERTPNTFDAHRLIWLAGREGSQDEIVEALFRAYFIEGVEIGDRAALIAIAEAGGIAADNARDFLQDGEGSAEVRADQAEASRLGIDGVPYFRINGKPAFSGAQRPELIAELLLEKLRRRHSTKERNWRNYLTR